MDAAGLCEEERAYVARHRAPHRRDSHKHEQVGTLKDLRPSSRGRSFALLMAREFSSGRPITQNGFWAVSRHLRVKYGKKLNPSWPQTKRMHVMDPGTSLPETLEAHPHALEWIVSDDFCVAPKQWPESMLGAFRHRLIPSPFEFGRIQLRKHVPFVSSDQAYFDYLYLKLFCYGMPVRLISAHFEIEGNHVHEGMYRSMVCMFNLPAFVVWATGTDFRRAKILPQMWHACSDDTAAGRGEFLSMLQSDLFLVGQEVLRPWVNSPLILSYLIYSTPKQPRDGVYFYCRYLDRKRL